MATLLRLDEEPRSDAADALALAMTYLRRAPVERALAERTRRVAVSRP
jgi:Holliday junction resolvasome RuvABC endonuclease subunit